MLGSVSRFWRSAYRVQYRLLALIDPMVRAFWRRFGIGNTVDLVVQRRSGGERARLVGLLQVGQARYVGHPNGHVGWTRDLAASGRATLVWPDGTRIAYDATELPQGEEREAAIRATGQHPFPGNLMYRLGRGHIRAVGVFFRLAPAQPNR
jgi:hypothetical protein